METDPYVALNRIAFLPKRSLASTCGVRAFRTVVGGRSGAPRARCGRAETGTPQSCMGIGATTAQVRTVTSSCRLFRAASIWRTATSPSPLLRTDWVIETEEAPRLWGLSAGLTGVNLFAA
ncbi:hypothetical protein IQ62_05475 [Streptomyces scabiei]|nr:hypothetical protein IQ62_05475 [Streptomyces scabiei]